MSKPLWVRHDVTIAIHERVLADYGGQSGIHDAGLLESALARPQQIHAYDAPILPLSPRCMLAGSSVTTLYGQ